MPIKVQRYAKELRQYCVMPNAFTEDEVDKIVDLEDLQKFSRGQVGGAKNGKLDKKIRDSEIMWLQPDQNSGWLFDKFAALVTRVNTDHFMYDIDGFDAFQYTKYRKQEHYNWHYDMDITSSDFMRKISASVMLSDLKEYEGGEFEIVTNGNIENVQSYRLNRGDIIFFGSWMSHRVRPVTSGVRKSLVCWVMGKRTW